MEMMFKSISMEGEITLELYGKIVDLIDNNSNIAISMNNVDFPSDFLLRFESMTLNNYIPHYTTTYSSGSDSLSLGLDFFRNISFLLEEMERAGAITSFVVKDSYATVVKKSGYTFTGTVYSYFDMLDSSSNIKELIYLANTQNEACSVSVLASNTTNGYLVGGPNQVLCTINTSGYGAQLGIQPLYKRASKFDDYSIKFKLRDNFKNKILIKSEFTPTCFISGIINVRPWEPVEFKLSNKEIGFI